MFDRERLRQQAPRAGARIMPVAAPCAETGTRAAVGMSCLCCGCTDGKVAPTHTHAAVPCNSDTMQFLHSSSSSLPCDSGTVHLVQRSSQLVLGTGSRVPRLGALHQQSRQTRYTRFHTHPAAGEAKRKKDRTKDQNMDALDRVLLRLVDLARSGQGGVGGVGYQAGGGSCTGGHGSG